MANTAWRAIGSSVRGASHVREDRPNQDALLLDAPAGAAAHGSAAFAAVADGHGGARHFRSAVGSGLAVQAAREVLMASAASFESADAAARVQMAALELPQRIVGRWVEMARAELAAVPITEAEWALLEEREGAEGQAQVRADPLLAYGATLLAALATPSCLLLCQLGDGDTLLVAADGSTSRPLPADERLAGNFTTSICRAGAESDFRCVVLEGAAAKPALVLLSTDGYANSFRTDADYLKVGGDFLTLLQGHDLADVARQLPGILEHASSHGSGDDITLALMVADPRAVAASAAPAAIAPRDDAALLAARHLIGRQRALIVVLSLALLGGLAWTQRERFAGVAQSDGPRKVAEPMVPTGNPTALPAEGRDGGLAPLTPLAPLSPLVPASAAPDKAHGGATVQLSAIRALHTAGGIVVHAHLQSKSALPPACVLRAAVHGADGHELASASKKLDKPAKAGAFDEDVQLTVAAPKQAAAAKTMQASAQPQFSLRLDCGATTVASSLMQAVSP